MRLNAVASTFGVFLGAKLRRLPFLQRYRSLTLFSTCLLFCCPLSLVSLLSQQQSLQLALEGSTCSGDGHLLCSCWPARLISSPIRRPIVHWADAKRHYLSSHWTCAAGCFGRWWLLAAGTAQSNERHPAPAQCTTISPNGAQQASDAGTFLATSIQIVHPPFLLLFPTSSPELLHLHRQKTLHSPFSFLFASVSHS